jgi:predicted nucleic acid-binding protein
MNVECFLDTNVIVYAVGRKPADEPKRRRAIELLLPGEFGTSGQVLQEFFVTVTTKIEKPLPAEEAIEWVDRLSIRPVVAIDENIVKNAIGISQRHLISYWDGAIIAAAEMLGAPILYTEDLNDGQLYGSVRAINPFRVN